MQVENSICKVHKGSTSRARPERPEYGEVSQSHIYATVRRSGYLLLNKGGSYYYPPEGIPQTIAILPGAVYTYFHNKDDCGVQVAVA